MKGYAILSEKENLKLLCFRGGFSLKKIIDFNDGFSEKNIINHIKKELDISNIDFKIDKGQKYRFYELEVKTLPLYMSKIFSVFRHFIGGILIIFDKN